MSINTPYGEVSATRTIALLKELCVSDGGIQTGPFGSQLHNSDYVIDGTPIITVEHLRENEIDAEGAPGVSAQDASRLSKYTLAPGDIVFSRVGSVDRRSLVSESEKGWLFSGRLIRIRPNASLVDPTYLSYFFGLKAFKSHIRRIAVGATMPSLNTQIMQSLPIVLPELKAQKSIGEILSQIDSLIRLNAQQAWTLELIAQTIFKSWFVDFDPVHAKARGEQPKGMDAETAALFPDSFEDSELGPIPRGWQAGPVSKILTLQGGYSFKSKDWTKSGVPVVKIGSVRPGFVDFTQGSFVSPELAAGVPSKYELPRGSLVIGLSGYVGEVGLVEKLNVTPLLNQRVARFGLVNSHWKIPFAYSMTRDAKFKDEVIASATGSAQANVSTSDILAIGRPIPPEQLVERFDNLLEAHFQQMLVLREQNAALRALRGSLLPRLVSGELEIPEGLLGE